MVQDGLFRNRNQSSTIFLRAISSTSDDTNYSCWVQNKKRMRLLRVQLNLWGFETVAILVPQRKVVKWWLQQSLQLDSSALIWYKTISDASSLQSVWPIRKAWRDGQHLLIQDGDTNNGSGRWDEMDSWLVFWLCEHPAYEHSWEAEWRLHVLFIPSFEMQYRLSFWCWWIKAQTGNRIRRKDSQGLPYIVEQLSTPLIHLIHFSQLLQDSNLRRRVLRDTQSQVHPHQYQQKEGKKLNLLKIHTVGVHWFNILP